MKEIEFDTTGKTPDYLLYGRTSITKVTDNSASTTAVGQHAFDGCTNLSSYTIQKSAGYIVDEYAFQNCVSLTSLPEFPLTEVKDHAFDGCSSLSDTPSLENAAYIGDDAFHGCSSITSIKVPNASYFGYSALAGCDSLSELEIPFVGTTIDSSEAFGVIFGTSTRNSYSVAQLSKTYYIPSKLTKLTIGGSSIKGDSCSNLTSVTDLTVKGSVVSIGNGAFRGLDSLESITLPFVGGKDGASDYTSVLGYVFGYGTSGSFDSDYKNDNTFINNTFGSGVAGATWQYSMRSGRYNSYYYYIPATLRSVTVTVDATIPVAAFNGCDMLEEIHLPLGTRSIGAYSFQGCSSLKRLNSSSDGVFEIPSLVSCIPEYSFSGCSLVEEFRMSDDVTSIGAYSFIGCPLVSKFNSSAPSSVVVPSSCETIGEYAFKGFGLITSLTVGDGVESIGVGAFKGMSSLETMAVPFVGKSDGASDISAVLGYVFGYGTSGSFDSDYKNDNTFINNTFGSGVAGATWQYSMRSGRYNSYYYYIPATLRSVTVTVDATIPVAAFNGCDMLEEIHLINCVESIGDYAFQNCSAFVDYSIVPSKSGAWDGSSISSSYHSGSGTVSDPYIIFSGKEFAYFISQLNAGLSTKDLYFEITSNIDLGGHQISVICPTESSSFDGHLNGNGHKISNFSLAQSANNVIGLFGFVDGLIENIGFENVTINYSTNSNSDAYCGGLVGVLSGTLENVYLVGEAVMTSVRTAYFGGLVGSNSGAVKNCYSNVALVTKSSRFKCFAGGLVGLNDGSITNSFSAGDISGTGFAEVYTFVSGLVGETGQASVINDSYVCSSIIIKNSGDVSTSSNQYGISLPVDEIISYCKTNWKYTGWYFSQTVFPRYK